ncbi:MAG: hypothetical protein AAGC55_01255 [Myxococcota bacterium]
MNPLRPVEVLIAKGAARAEVFAALDRCFATLLPEDLPAFYGLRMAAAQHYGDPDPPRADLEAYLALSPSLLQRGHKLPSVCATWPELSAEYLPSLIAELSAVPGDMWRALEDGARRVLARAEAEPDDLES